LLAVKFATYSREALNLGRQGHFEISRYFHKIKILPANVDKTLIKKMVKVVF
jgi:hypothetical protein